MYKKILQTTYDMIADLGCDDTNLYAVANMMGISEAVLHQYFTSKEDLLASLLKVMIKEFNHKETFEGNTRSALRYHLISIGHGAIDYLENHHKFIKVIEALKKAALRSEVIHQLISQYDYIEKAQFSSALKQAFELKLIDKDTVEELTEILYLMYKGISDTLVHSKKSYKKIWTNTVQRII